MLGQISSIIEAGLIKLIKIYRYFFSAFFGQQCRFFPSCSEYALIAIEKHGAFKGSLLAIKRILKCHPWHSGGIDMVPEVKSLETNHPS